MIVAEDSYRKPRSRPIDSNIVKPEVDERPDVLPSNVTTAEIAAAAGNQRRADRKIEWKPLHFPQPNVSASNRPRRD